MIPRTNARGELLYDAVRSGPIVLTENEANEVVARAEKLKLLLSDTNLKATYKIEIMFGKARSATKPTPGVISFWVSGNRLHGGGDEKLYLCPGDKLKKNGCQTALLDHYNNGSGITCPGCGTIWKHEEVIGELLFNLPMQLWADVLLRYFKVLKQDCDIYLKFAPEDIRSVTKAQVDKATWKGSQVLERARNKRARASYRLRNIILDLQAGADLLKRFRAFITA
jgi:hypothetical protein